jgi:hypothetical protein
MKRRLSGIILATEIAAIVLLHVFKLNHQPKNDGISKAIVMTQPLRMNTSYTVSVSR